MIWCEPVTHDLFDFCSGNVNEFNSKHTIIVLYSKFASVTKPIRRLNLDKVAILFENRTKIFEEKLITNYPEV